MKHSHYHKDVSGLKSVDVYRVLKLFGVTDPCLQHAIKKLLVAGERGSKDVDQDVQEAIDTLERWKAMREEDRSIDSSMFYSFDESRIDIVGQNGNDGLHYGHCLGCKKETCECE